MKKLFAVTLCLVLGLTAVCAVAETRTYEGTAVTDADGNEVAIEDQAVPFFSFDEDTAICAFGTADATVSGTYEIDEASTDDETIMNCALDDGTSIVVKYITADDTCTYVDADNYTWTMTMVEEEAPAEEETAA